MCTSDSATTKISTDTAKAYLRTLQYEHGCLYNPPFDYLDSTVWYYRPWREDSLQPRRDVVELACVNDTSLAHEIDWNQLENL